eukprot:4029550-Alexandrium_andersonii.AAC.1
MAISLATGNNRSWAPDLQESGDEHGGRHGSVNLGHLVVAEAQFRVGQVGHCDGTGGWAGGAPAGALGGPRCQLRVRGSVGGGPKRRVAAGARARGWVAAGARARGWV